MRALPTVIVLVACTRVAPEETPNATDAAAVDTAWVFDVGAPGHADATDTDPARCARQHGAPDRVTPVAVRGRATIRIRCSGYDTCPERSLTLSIDVAGFVLTPPGKCAGRNDCGHLYVRFDGDRCNQPGQPHAALVDSLPAKVDICKACSVTSWTAPRPHWVSVEARDDNGRAFDPPWKAEDCCIFWGGI